MEVKVCRDCSRVNPYEADYCIECGGEDFDDLELDAPFWDSVEPYEEENNDFDGDACRAKA